MSDQKGIGGAPTRATTIPEDAPSRKRHPVASGVLDYFPDALVALANVSWHGNEHHNPGQPLHWARGKSGDHADALVRHFLQRGTRDTDGIRHSAKIAWRALAMLQEEIEAEQAQTFVGEPGMVIKVAGRAADIHRGGGEVGVSTTERADGCCQPIGKLCSSDCPRQVEQRVGSRRIDRENRI